ncbi:hypothetical protein O0L34_g10300 [Tuta absoluta]|nr:hypothetical protein O0L34_g10300 [Tuta absoluta]
MAIDNLPLETFFEILKNTDGCTLARCREVCKAWKEIIDTNDFLWQEFCSKDYKYSSRIAKSKAGHECKWHHIYKNLKMWTKVSTAEKNLRPFWKFTLQDKYHVLDTDYNILPLRDKTGFMLYEISTLKYFPVVIPERNCLKISNNDHSTVILTKSGLFLQKTVQSAVQKSEAFFKADNFVLANDTLYFFNNRDVYKCELLSEDIFAEQLIHCDYDIKEMQVNNKIIYLFTDCGNIVTITENNVTVNPISVPVEWLKQIKHICPLDNKNFVCYSRNLFKIETDKYKHLYLDFPPITALFFYGEVVIIGTRAGDILLYRLSSQKYKVKPIFENLAKLPDDTFAVHLDVCEKKSGPVIVIATFYELMILEINFFPNEQGSKVSFPPNKLCMYKRLMKLRDRLRTN